jgi:hypothetical protein
MTSKIRGVVKTINVSSNDLELIDFMLTQHEKVAKKIPDADLQTRNHMNMLHADLRQTLKDAK